MDNIELTNRLREKFVAYRLHAPEISLVDLGKEIGVSESTLSRFQNGIGKLDMDTLGRLSGFLGAHPISPGVKYGRPGETMSEIRIAIFNDESLSLTQKKALYDLMTVAYASFVRVQEEDAIQEGRP